MLVHTVRSSLLVVALALGVPASAGAGEQSAAPPSPAAEQVEFYEREVLPLLKEHCYKCHGGSDVKAGLRLSSRAGILQGGDSGPAVNLDDVDASLLLEAINYQSYEMPPSGKLPQAQIDVLTNWVKLGIPMPAGAVEEAVTRPHAPPQVNEETKNHWSFRPVVRPEVPAVKREAWVANPIDAFILAKLEEAGLSPNPPADKRALVRRVYYDLIGLPPTPEQVEEFLGDESAGAWEDLVNRLLESPHHGEHWARYWLDVVRYAESNSFERDNPKPFVWRYRDYVIRAFNNDKPYDRFIREQLAGDELDRVTPETIIATGFYRIGLWDDEPADPELAFYDGLDDIAATTAQGFLGITMNCARCHDHKIDPVPQSDYYRFIAFFRNVRHYGVRADETVFAASVRSIGTPEEETALDVQREAWEQRVAELRQQLDVIEDEVRPHLRGGERDDFQDDSVRLRIIRKHVGEHITQERFDEYAKRRKEWSDLRNGPPRSATQALCVKEQGPDAPATHVLIRGNPGAHGAEVAPGFPSVLSPPEPTIAKPASGESSGRRRALAEWIGSPDNPLTARVMMNRVWQWHFGRGIVRSSNDFGLQGTPPTHPELLDWLAAEFVERGWSLKAMHRLILTSNAYRMTSRVDGLSLKVDRPSVASSDVVDQPSTINHQPLSLDPQNDLFWRFDMRRLRAEEIRDSVLAVNGTLNLKQMFGPSIYPVIPSEVLAGQSRPGQGWGKSSREERNRRSVYIHIKRSLPVPILAAFDAPDPDVTCPVRFATTQPTQALTLLNSAFLNEEAGVFADSLRREAGENAAARVTLALRRTMQRDPTDADVDRGVELMRGLQQDHRLSADEALRYFCLVALNLNEFVYLD
jgi:hypothetical protein